MGFGGVGKGACMVICGNEDECQHHKAEQGEVTDEFCGALPGTLGEGDPAQRHRRVCMHHWFSLDCSSLWFPPLFRSVFGGLVGGGEEVGFKNKHTKEEGGRENEMQERRWVDCEILFFFNGNDCNIVIKG